MARIRQCLMPYSVLLIALLAISGCTTSSLFSKLTHKQKFTKANAANPAVRCLCLWESSEGTGVDNKPTRGVSGQIFFFTRGDSSSVEVDGDVRIYVFDDEGSADDQAQPLHQFDFLAGTWKAHLTSTQFGPAYQLFVPYSRKGRHQAELALRVRLTPANGSPLYSDIAKVTLPGYERAKAKAGSDAYDPETPQASQSADDKFTRVDRITPEKIGETLLQVLAERREAVGSTQLAEASINPRSKRPARRGSAPYDNEAGGEFNVIDKPHDASDPPTQRLLRQVPQTVEEVGWEDEE
ncbi:MAG: hypothetical protein IAG10_03010 [Planctomycetaceae bacterium]|nr:hypothetical protein [Planctomycetaceae bacterium]